MLIGSAMCTGIYIPAYVASAIYFTEHHSIIMFIAGGIYIWLLTYFDVRPIKNSNLNIDETVRFVSENIIKSINAESKKIENEYRSSLNVDFEKQ